MFILVIHVMKSILLQLVICNTYLGKVEVEIIFILQIVCHLYVNYPLPVTKTVTYKYTISNTTIKYEVVAKAIIL